jgi:hypothetical protein
LSSERSRFLPQPDREIGLSQSAFGHSPISSQDEDVGANRRTGLKIRNRLIDHAIAMQRVRERLEAFGDLAIR